MLLFKKQKRQRLLQELANALHDLALARDQGIDIGFDMRTWARGKAPTSPKLDCGTQACAAGLATTLPSWKAEGFKLTGYMNSYVVAYEDKYGYRALEKLLDIPYFEVKALFCPSFYQRSTDPHLVATRIEDYLHERGDSWL